MEYLQLLRAEMPDVMPICIELDSGSIHDQVFLAQLTQKDVYDPLHLILKQHLDDKKANSAICLPTPKKILKSHYLELKKSFDYLMIRQIPYRLIPESLLLAELEGVDFLYVAPSTFTSQTRRKLQGFEAAGGIVISL